MKMPHLRLETNVPANKIPEDFVLRAISVIARTLGKPENVCAVSVIPNLPMAFGASACPCAIATLWSISGQGIEENKRHSAEISTFVMEVLQIPNDRMYIHFITVRAENVGFKGTTYHDISI